MRMMRRFREPDIVPIQPARLPSWSPLHIEKRQHCCEHCPSLLDKKRKRKKKQRDRTLVAILVILLFCLLGNTVFLDVHTLRSTVAPPSDEAVTNTSTSVSSSALSAQAQQCLSQYIINAPSDPASYPCSTCYSVLQAVPSNFSDGNPQDPQQIENAIQFCGLRSIFDIASTSGQAGLSTGGG
ncbi:hypothetical protein A0H81_10288 [Grifola frondosa]|uniref:Uncharacterized protein n=1 Tax=Grifola frondosa TaxID=5627 RepID=A0A1C7M399_GRIFR|nr:hypothetical protein A0H81_10288 [Grifola frondosa]